MICEQRNSWISQYSSQSKHMGYEKFQFWMYIIFDTYNEITIEGRLTIANYFIGNKAEYRKRKRLNDDSYDEDDI